MNLRGLTTTIALLVLTVSCTDNSDTTAETTTTKAPRKGIIPDDLCDEMRYNFPGAFAILTPSSITYAGDIFASLKEYAPVELHADIDVFTDSVYELAEHLETFGQDLSDEELNAAILADLRSGKFLEAPEPKAAAKRIDAWVIPDCSG